MKRTGIVLKGLVLVLLTFGLAGCDTLEDLFEDEKETSGIVEEIGDDFLVVDGIEYRVTSETEFDGLDGLEDLSVGDEVEIEYEEDGDIRVALEIEVGDDD